MRVKVFTDGASRGNPGHAGLGVVVYDQDGTIVKQSGEYIGQATNNVAEYKALIAGLKLANKYITSKATFFLDSELVVRQMIGQYRVKDEVLKTFHKVAIGLAAKFEEIDFKHVLREKNKVADSLANKAIDAALKKKKKPHDPVLPKKVVQTEFSF